MNQLVTRGIVLTRIDYGEADRIVTMLTPDAGKLGLMAKGVRRIKSKLAGGIELFSVSEITYIPGRGSLCRLISTRLVTHYGNITTDLHRTMLGYELLKLLHKTTEDQTEPEHYALLETALAALNDSAIPADVVAAWYNARLLTLAGYQPNMLTDVNDAKLVAESRYDFDFGSAAFRPEGDGAFAVNEIKFLRLLCGGNARPVALAGVHDAAGLSERCLPLLQGMRQYYMGV